MIEEIAVKPQASSTTTGISQKACDLSTFVEFYEFIEVKENLWFDLWFASSCICL